MTEPQSLSVTFAPGTRAACATSTMVLLVDRPLSDELVLRAWESMSRGDEAAQIVDILMTDGMIHAPHFALVALPDHHTTRIVVRGSLSVLGVEEGGEFHTSGGSLLTDESRGRLVRARITAEVTDDPAMFHTSLAREFELVRSHFGFTGEELRSIARNAWDYRFSKGA